MVKFCNFRANLIQFLVQNGQFLFGTQCSKLFRLRLDISYVIRFAVKFNLVCRDDGLCMLIHY